MKKNDRSNSPDQKKSEFEERVLEVSRVSRVVKGGRRMRFRVLVVIGNKNGKIGFGSAKSNEVALSVKKAVTRAKKTIITVPIINETIPYQVYIEDGSAKIMLRPAAKGTSIVAGGVVRAIADLAGIHNLVSKVIGTSNKTNNVAATFKALSSFDPDKVEIIKNRHANSEVLIPEKEKSVEKVIDKKDTK